MKREELLTLLQPDIRAIDQAMRDDLGTIGDSMLDKIVNHAIFSGGKRIRPLLCILSARVCGGNSDEITRLAMAFEYLHVATLLHDDVIDNAATRRGKPSVNALWGITPAILAGDHLHARSMYLVGRTGGIRALEIICRTTTAMVEGELEQMKNATNFNQSEEDYFRVIRNKSALLISAVCETGALHAGAGDEKTAALRAYGSNLGSAFQIIDDILDYQGDPGQTGKVVGNDFCEGKMTLPLIHALGHGTAAEQKRIRTLLAGPVELRQQALPEIREIFSRHSSFDYARKRAEHSVSQALAALEVFTDPPVSLHAGILAGIGHYVLTRNK